VRGRLHGGDGALHPFAGARLPVPALASAPPHRPHECGPALRPSLASLLRPIIPPLLPSSSQRRWGGVGAGWRRRSGGEWERWIAHLQIEWIDWLISRRDGRRISRDGLQRGWRRRGTNPSPGYRRAGMKRRGEKNR